MRSIADEMLRQGSHNQIIASHKKIAKELAKLQVEVVSTATTKAELARFQKQLGEFFDSVPSPYLAKIIDYYNKTFQKELQNAN